MMAVRSRNGRGRRMKSEINVVPYIDVMLVLLVIFMITAPLVAPGMIELPSVSQRAAEVPVRPIEVQVAADGVISVRDLEQGETQLQPVPATELPDYIRMRQQAQPNQPVVIAADGKVVYDSVVKIMDQLQREGVSRVGLLVQQGGPGS
ncbi:protein TolR [Verticiella sediminum]|uniref:Protein TolR n=1 Tax=Verticiella sediminum TaxID=1247510 RepID=A0A556B0Z9_9BURK|nr:protein TolR [Verticiella sediminum]TSH98866.1 protein TolR [Verticiella sediminum]